MAASLGVGFGRRDEEAFGLSELPLRVQVVGLVGVALGDVGVVLAQQLQAQVEGLLEQRLGRGIPPFLNELIGFCLPFEGSNPFLLGRGQ